MQVNNKTLNAIIIGLYLMALMTKSFTGGGGVYGISALIFGGLSIVIGDLFAFGAWFANVLFFIVLFRTLKLNTKLTVSGIALLLAGLAIFVTDLPMHMGSTTSPVNLGVGFFFWMGSITLLFVDNFLEFINQNPK